jgi:hypothetical protein
VAEKVQPTWVVQLSPHVLQQRVMLLLLSGIISGLVHSPFFSRASLSILHCGRFLYPLNIPLKEKIEAICKEIYGAEKVDYSELAENRLEVYMRKAHQLS